MEVRNIATNVDWPCEVKTLFRDSNLGCRRAVSGALDWFFDQEQYGIVLEDDCLPSDSWFPFAEEMLKRFKDDERIMCISATHFHGDTHNPPESYFFSIYNHCWGWASWRRAWQHYDHDMRRWPTLRDTNWLENYGGRSLIFKRYWSRVFQTAYEGKRVDSWAYRWTFSCWAQNGLTVLPARNLVRNIGFGAEATHTSAGNSIAVNLPLQTMEFPLEHPAVVVRDVDADQWTTRRVFGVNALSEIRASIKGLLGLKRRAPGPSDR
jgi:hypothetical protein